MTYILLLFLCCSCLFASDGLSAYERLFGRSEPSVPNTVSQTHSQAVTVRVAILDLGIVQLLHPAMKDFHFEANTFLRPVANPKLDAKFVMEQRRNAYLQIRDEHANRLIARDRLKRSIEQEILWEKSHLNKKINDRIRDIKEQEKLSDAIATVEKEAWDNIFALESKLKQQESEYQNWLKANVEDNFLSQDERDERLAEISKEIQDAIQSVASEQKYAIVLDSISVSGKSDLNLTESNLATAAGFSGENSLAKVLGNRAPLGGSGQVRVSPDQAYENLLPHFSQYQHVRDTFAQVVAPITFLGPKPDITEAVLQAIWQKHKIPGSLQNQLIAALGSRKKVR